MWNSLAVATVAVLVLLVILGKPGLPIFSARALGAAKQQSGRPKSNFPPLHRGKIYFCLVLFSLWSIDLYSAHATAAQMLIGRDCRLPAEFCVCSREAALHETSRSSGGSWAIRWLFSLLKAVLLSPHPTTSTRKICSIWAKSVLYKGNWSL